MQSIHIYFASSWVKGVLPPPSQIGVTNKLVSYIYPEQLQEWFDVTNGDPGNMMLDSGAFSAWNKGYSIQLSEYIAYAKDAIEKAKDHNKELRVVNLDVIPGQVGQTKRLNQAIGNRNQLLQNKAIIEAAAQEGYYNLRKMKKEGITPIHVFHQGENFKWLDKMLDLTDYIGISPANDMALTSKKEWIHSVFEYLYKKNANPSTHGFAVLIPELMKSLPWTSCDAASWKLMAAWGTIIYPSRGYQFKFTGEHSTIAISEKRVSKGIKGLTPAFLSLLEKDGYSFEDLQHWGKRAELNAKFYVTMENWLNEQKQKLQYKPYISLL